VEQGGTLPVDLSGLVELRQLQPPDQPGAVERVVRAFLVETTRRLETLSTAANTGDVRQIERAAHALKGIAGTVGANEIHELAVRLEVIGREGRAQDAAQLVKELQSAFGRAQPVFETMLDGRGEDERSSGGG
jgi:two-component system sensor histidine kinase/response regulator